MNEHRHKRKASAWAILVVASGMVAGPVGVTAHAQSAQHYKQTNLVSDLPSMAITVDPNLVNPWGIARGSGGPWWVSDNGPGLSTLYNGAGAILKLVVTIPPSKAGGSTGTPTGIVFNGSPDFEVAKGAPAIFLFVSEDGTISGWNPGVNPLSAVKVIDQEQRSVYKGATIATVHTTAGELSYLYVADFRGGRVRAFDSHFQPVLGGEERFDDDTLPPGYAPFNIQNIGGNLYVSFAKQDAAKHDEVDGTGLGFVDVFTPGGKLVQRLQSGPWFNAPWGMALASGDFGIFSHDLLVGQFGSGEILVFNPVTGTFKGRLRDQTGKAIQIDGLWGLGFGNDGPAGQATSLFFTAGLNHEQNGLFGNITAVENVRGSDE